MAQLLLRDGFNGSKLGSSGNAGPRGPGLAKAAAALTQGVLPAPLQVTYGFNAYLHLLAVLEPPLQQPAWRKLLRW